MDEIIFITTLAQKYQKNYQICSKPPIAFVMRNSSIQSDKIVIGYYPIRSKAQVCRLLCEYLHLPYQDLFFTPKSWQQFRQSQITNNWTYAELPFMKHKDFVATQTYPICLYLINMANRKDILGRTLQDQCKVDMFLSQLNIVTQVQSYYVSVKECSEQVRKQGLQKLWQRNIFPKIKQYERNSRQNFYLGYISLIDFYLYEVVISLRYVFPSKITQFQKINSTYQRLYNIPEIKNYEESKRAVKELCPIEFCAKWKEKCNSQL